MLSVGNQAPVVGQRVTALVAWYVGDGGESRTTTISIVNELRLYHSLGP